MSDDGRSSIVSRLSSLVETRGSTPDDIGVCLGTAQHLLSISSYLIGAAVECWSFSLPRGERMRCGVFLYF
jgi:hypothetical protein